MECMTRTAQRLLQQEIVDERVALRVPAVDEDGDAGLRGTCSEGHAQLGITTTAGPVRSPTLHTQVHKGAIYKGRKRVSVVGLHRDGLVTLARGRTAGSYLQRVRTAMYR